MKNEIENLFRALELFASTDSTRISIMPVRVLVDDYEKDRFRLIATDGHRALFSPKDTPLDYIIWCRIAAHVLDTTGQKLPENPENGYVVLGKKAKAALKAPLTWYADTEKLDWMGYPKFDNVVPSVFESNIVEYPVISIENQLAYQKAHKLLTGRDPFALVLDRWNSRVGATIKDSGYHGMQYLFMPMRSPALDDKRDEANNAIAGAKYHNTGAME